MWCLYTQLSGSQAHKKRQIQNRWLVAYTLVHNPCLCKLRASNLRAEESVKRDYPELNMNGDDPELKF